MSGEDPLRVVTMRPTDTTPIQELRASVGAQWTLLSDPGHIPPQEALVPVQCYRGH